MERLTEKHFGADDYYMKCSKSCANDDEMCGGCPELEKMVNLLAAYEDTGLEPNDVVDMMEVLLAGVGFCTANNFPDRTLPADDEPKEHSGLVEEG